MAINWSAALDNLSQGLSRVAQMRDQREQMQNQQNHEDMRDAANRAFQENMLRLQQGFHQQELNQTQGFEQGQQQRSQEFQAGESAKNRALQAQEHGQTMGMEGARINLEKQRLEEDTAFRNMQEKNAENRANREIGSEGRKNALDQAKVIHDSIMDAAKPYQSQIDQIDKELQSPMMMADDEKQQPLLQRRDELTNKLNGILTDGNARYAKALQSLGIDASGAPAAPKAAAAPNPQGGLQGITSPQGPQANTFGPQDAFGDSQDQSQPQQPSPQDIAANLGQTTQGQATASILNSYLQSQGGPQSDKLRRAAYLGIQNTYPDTDPDAVIDAYTQANGSADQQQGQQQQVA